MPSKALSSEISKAHMNTISIPPMPLTSYTQQQNWPFQRGSIQGMLHVLKCEWTTGSDSL